MDYGYYKPQGKTAQQQSFEMYEKILELIKENDITFVVNKYIDLTHTNKFKGLDLARLKERILIACGQTNAIYIDPDTFGWERYMIEKANTPNKITIVNKAYGIDLKKDKSYTNEEYREIANTIVITEAVALGRINGKPRQFIDYDFRIVKRGETLD